MSTTKSFEERQGKDKEEDIPLSKVTTVIVKDPIQRLCALVCFCMRLAPQLRLVKPRQRRSLHKYKNNMDVGLRFSSPCDSTVWLLEGVSLPHDSTAWLAEGGDSTHVSSIPRFYTNGVDAPNCEIGVLFCSENEASWRIALRPMDGPRIFVSDAALQQKGSFFGVGYCQSTLFMFL